VKNARIYFLSVRFAIQLRVLVGKRHTTFMEQPIFASNAHILALPVMLVLYVSVACLDSTSIRAIFANIAISAVKPTYPSHFAFLVQSNTHFPQDSVCFAQMDAKPVEIHPNTLLV
jgi:hypothetical protein